MNRDVDTIKKLYAHFGTVEAVSKALWIPKNVVRDVLKGRTV